VPHTDSKTYQAAPLQFRGQSTVSNFRLIDPPMDSDYMTLPVNAQVGRIYFNQNKYGQYQGTVKVTNQETLAERYVRTASLGTSRPKQDVTVEVKDALWAGDSVTLTWPFLPGSAQKELKAVRAMKDGKALHMGPGELMEKLRTTMVKSVDVKHSWFASKSADANNNIVKITHRFELLSLIFKDDE
jgi:hypothetical protein